MVRRLCRAILAGSRGFEYCLDCGGDMVSPVGSSPAGEDGWAMRLRCGRCGFARDVVASKAQAADYDETLERQHRRMERALKRLSGKLMADEAERLAEALRRDLIDAGDFGPRARRESG